MSGIMSEEITFADLDLSPEVMDSLKKMETLLGDYALVHYGEVYSALRKKLPKGTELPHLAVRRETLSDKIRRFFKKTKK